MANIIRRYTQLRALIEADGVFRAIIERFSKNRQEEENTITFRLKCIVIA